MIILKNAKEKNTPHAKCGAGGDVALPSWCACYHRHPRPCCPCPCFHLMGGRCCLVLLPLTVAVYSAPGCPVVWPGLHPHCCFVAVSVLALPSTLQAVARSSGGGCWVMLVILLCWALPHHWSSPGHRCHCRHLPLHCWCWCCPVLSCCFCQHGSPSLLSLWPLPIFAVQLACFHPTSSCSQWWGASGRCCHLCLTVHPCPHHPVLSLS